MCLSYVGGKSRIGKWIQNYIPTTIKSYAEPFGGMYWTFFSLDIDSFNLDKVIYNDVNHLNVNFFRSLNDYNNLLEQAKNIPCQQKGDTNIHEDYKNLFQSFQKEIYQTKPITNVDHLLASKYAYVLTQVFSGSNPEKAQYIDLKGKYKSKYMTFIDKLKNPEWQKKFKLINTFENLDFETLIKQYDNESFFMYLDPPYYIVGEGDYYSNHNFTNDDHKRLADVLQDVKGKFALSYYHFDKLEEWYPRDKFRWESKEFAKAAGASKGKKQSKGTELLIMNY